ncbi:MAG: RNase III inhibitor [Ruminococcaceae bacterium]|nr:RNase III inhibitor [Oscillospiraceae bacterium]
MPLYIVRQDITKIKTDAIVNPTNEKLIPGGGVDAAIHAAAGARLADACSKLDGCEVGGAKITPGFDLSCKYIIHTVGPIWQGGLAGERKALESCYTESLSLAEKKRCKTVAFPLISSGSHGYPKDQVLKVAMASIGKYLEKHEMTVYLVVYDKTSYSLGEQLSDEITSYIDDNYVNEHAHRFGILKSKRVARECAEPVNDRCDGGRALYDMPVLACSEMPRSSLEDALGRIDESFSQMLLRKIDEAGMKDSECYKKANIDRKLFSKIRSDKHYKPSKTTVIAFAIALELTLEETKDMLMKAGFALSRSNKFDIIIEFFIERGNYDLYEINEALFTFDQPLLGA